MKAPSSLPIAITLPDGRVRRFAGPVTGAEIAAAIGPGLARAALAVKVDDEVKDLAARVERDARVAIVTRDSAEALEILRHDAAHVMAEAVKELYPETQVTFGPATETGFYYDFARDQPFTPEDLEKIEKRMHEIVDRDEPISREEWERDRAVAFFDSIGEKYKAEWINEIPRDEAISLYRQGGFVGVCTGPHLPSTGKLGHAFKLMKVAGDYWRGDARNQQLQRVYGTAWPDEKALKQYLFQLEEAEKRDHRRLGRELDLFHQQEEAVGSVFWHPKGWTLYRVIESYLRNRLDQSGYLEVKTPQLIDRSLWERSGHWEKFRHNMFTVRDEDEGRERVLAIKPMNCPGAVQIFRQHLHSYRELPLRLAEFGSCPRNEPSGARHAAGRFRPAGAARRQLYRRGRTASHAGHAPPRHFRLDGAIHRHLDRALCRPVSAVAGAGPGGGGHHHLRCRRLCRGSSGRVRRGGPGRRGRPAQREGQLQDPRAPPGPNPRPPGGRPPPGGERQRRAPRA